MPYTEIRQPAGVPHQPACDLCGAYVHPSMQDQHDRFHVGLSGDWAGAFLGDGIHDIRTPARPAATNETDAAVAAWQGPGEYVVLTRAQYEGLTESIPGGVDHLPLYVGIPVPDLVGERLREIVERRERQAVGSRLHEQADNPGLDDRWRCRRCGELWSTGMESEVCPG